MVTKNPLAFCNIHLSVTESNDHLPPSPPILSILTGTSQWWYGLHVDYVAGNGGIKKVEMRTSGSGNSFDQVTCDKSQGPSFFICHFQSPLVGPLDVRLTDTYGRTLVGTSVITDFDGGKEFDFGTNFASIDGGTSSPTVTLTASPTQAPTSVPTSSPIAATPLPTAEPTGQPVAATPSPTAEPTGQPVAATPSPTAEPTGQPIAATPSPTAEPTGQPIAATPSPTVTATSPPTTGGGSSCGTDALKQADYRGTISVTETGKTCQRWDTKSPHRHSRTVSNYPDSGLEENYCRNPDGK